MNTLSELLNEQLRDLYSAEKQLLKALPGMAKKATTPSLKAAFTSHLEETMGQVGRLETMGQILGIKMTGKVCKAMKGLIEEGKEVIAEKGSAPVLDAALIAAAQRVEHYEISGYGSARALAEVLGHRDIAELLQQTHDEERLTDKKLTAISMDDVFPQALNGMGKQTSGMADKSSSSVGRAKSKAA